MEFINNIPPITSPYNIKFVAKFPSDDEDIFEVNDDIYNKIKRLN